MEGKFERYVQENSLRQHLASTTPSADYVKQFRSTPRNGVAIDTGLESPKTLWVPGDSLTELAVTSARAIAAKPGTHFLLDSNALEAFRYNRNPRLPDQKAIRTFPPVF